MSLPTSQQRILDGIEDGLRAHDLRLASLFATFTRLTNQEEMPKVEQLAPGGAMSSRPGLPPRSRLARLSGLLRPPPAYKWRTGRVANGTSRIVFVPIVLVAAISALVLGLLVSAHQPRCTAVAVSAASGSSASGSSASGSLASGSSMSRSSECPVRHASNARH
jgi:hypothetical protein